jgi:polysaccharide export outer membrane protein
MKWMMMLLLVCTAPAVFAQIPTPSPLSAASVGQAGAAPAPTAAPGGNNSASFTPGFLHGFVSDDTYKLRVGDTVSFQILEDRILEIQAAPTTLAVADSGELDVPYIGRVMAAGKTCKDVAQDIKVLLEKDYYKQATVVISLNIANRLYGRVYIWGQVHNQGGLDMQVNENLTAGQAILRAGGLGDFANKKKVKVVRASAAANGDKQTFDLDMTEILENGKTEKDILLQPGDLIIVPSRLFNF